ncbi:Peptidyl-tRNA hydrolase ICT1, mitochondrial [Strongyloides ratti]|uniref:Large ribosomal subunit protein mL62 n=1 Tax=Strongyloides ratti TaxID=34506 RepID=A0A090LAN9_STRRB|nr:Peptidyl-tRNA hydrolase ICT1, mitochondrial [Strongyloides ratti]CEF66856.1 Peptidyl-tRNA hydrolase ICT1, mitochondrial [Strongyloides ratti]
MIRINFIFNYTRNLCSNVKNNSNKLQISFPKVKKEFIRSSGPGGQNVNQVSTKVQLTCHIDDVCGITNDLKEYVKEKHKLTKYGEIIVESDKFRTQNDNNADCYQKLYDIFEKYHKELQFINRVPTKEELKFLEKREERKAKYRLEEKRRRALKKQSRSTDF